MKDYPDVTMVTCPIRGPVFYAEGLGERAFKSPQAAQEACNKFRAQRELSQQERDLTSPNRVVVYCDHLEVFTDNEIVNWIDFPDAHTMRRIIGDLPQWETHKFIHIKPMGGQAKATGGEK